MENIKSTSLRLLSVVLAIAVLFSFSAVMFSISASAEEQAASSSDVTLDNGILGKYQCIRFRYTDEISCQTLYDKFMALGTDYVYGEVFGYKDGKFFTYTNNGIAFDKNSSNLTIQFNGASFFGVWLEKEYLKTARFCLTESNGHVVSTYKYLNKDGDYSNGNLVTIARNSTLSEFASLYGDTFYAIFTGSNSAISTDTMKAFESDVINGYKDSDYKVTSSSLGGSENGRFICFGDYAEYSYDEHLLDISSNSIYQRSDYNSQTQEKYTAFMFDNQSCFDWADKRYKENKIKSYNSNSVAFNFYNDDSSVGAVKLRVSATLLRPSMRQSDNPFDVGNYFTQHPANQHYSRYVVISEGSLKSVPAKSTATFRINLQGYCNMNFNTYYLLEIVNGKNSEIISSVMFLYTGKDTFKLDGSNNKDGNLISVDYEYKDGNNVKYEDLIPDDDGVLPSLPNGEKDETFNPIGNYDLSSLDINDIFSSLNQATASVGAFFQATLNIIPVSIMTIIIGSLALLIVLRVLGR